MLPVLFVPGAPFFRLRFFLGVSVAQKTLYFIKQPLESPCFLRRTGKSHFFWKRPGHQPVSVGGDDMDVVIPGQVLDFGFQIAFLRAAGIMLCHQQQVLILRHGFPLQKIIYLICLEPQPQKRFNQIVCLYDSTILSFFKGFSNYFTTISLPRCTE